MRHGTWQETGGGGIGIPVGQILIGAGVAGLAIAIAEAVAVVAEPVMIAVIVGIVVLAAAVFAGAVWATVYRLRRGEFPWARLVRNPSPEGFVRTLPGATQYEVPRPEVPAVEQHVHFHFGAGADPRAVEEILRRGQRPER